MSFVKAGKAALGMVLIAALAACGGFDLARFNPWGSTQERRQALPADATVYACGEGKRLTVRRLAGTASVMILFPEREFRLDEARATPGRYTNGSTTFATADGVATLEESGTVTYANCRPAAG